MDDSQRDNTANRITSSLRAAALQAWQRDAGPEYDLTPVAGDGDLVARGYCVSHRLQLAFSPQGPQVTLADGTELALELVALGRGPEDEAPLPAAPADIDDNEIRYPRGEVTEWYRNGPVGLEQGFDLDERPHGNESEPVRLTMVVHGGFVPELQGASVALLDETGTPRLRYGELYVEDRDRDPVRSWIEVDDLGRIVLAIDDRAADYPLAVDPFVWAQDAKLTPADGLPNRTLGEAVAVSGDTALVGASLWSFAWGAAYVFVRSGGGWSQQQVLNPINQSPGERFGTAVDIDGDRAIIGANQKSNGAGAAYIFQRSGSSWSQLAQLGASDGAQNDSFGSAVGISGDRAVVGARFDDDDGSVSGSAYVFARSGSNWIEEQKLTASDAAAGDQFGFSVSIDGLTLFVGARHDGNDQGAAYEFIRSGGQWNEGDKIVASDSSTGDEFAYRLRLDNNRVIVGAPLNGGGAAYVFVRVGNSWLEEQILTASDAAGGDSFGVGVALLGSRAIVGALGNDDNGSGSGSAYIFSLSGSTWTQESKITAPDAAAGDAFGAAVGLSSNYAFSGAPYDEDFGGFTGALYVFSREATQGTSCSLDADCQTGFCADGRCCNSACGNSDPTDCQGCSNALTGAADGTCTTVTSGVVCRSASGDCDLAETCSGSSLACPSDSVASNGTVCRASAGACDITETCNGGAKNCPSNGVQTPGSAGSPSCSPFVCSGGATCPNSCSSNFNCTAGLVCVSGSCVSPLGQGTACSRDDQCASSSCVDGFCCNATCGNGSSSDCQACAASLTGAANGTCAAVLAGSTCRSATGGCDVAEVCSGSSTTCPPDGVAPATMECRASAGTCDVAENCTGSSKTCPGNGFEPSSTVCRALQGACDVAETCTGSSSSCPSDGKESTSTVCRVATLPCDVTETCDGTNDDCPADAVAAITVECRASADSCDVAEDCDGTNKACPADLLASAGDSGSPSCAPYLCDGTDDGCATSCSVDGDCAAGNYCDTGICTSQLAQGVACSGDNECEAGFCADGVCCDSACGNSDDTDCHACTAALTGGSDGSCAPIPSGTACRASAGACDVAEQCDGTATACPADVVTPASTECRSAAGDCDPVEQCDGTSPTCPADLIAAAGTTCRPGVGECDAAERCDGIASSCPADQAAVDGTTCDDGETCTDGDECNGGVCQPGTNTCNSGGAGSGGSSGTAGAGAVTGAGGGSASGSGGGSSSQNDEGCSCVVVGDTSKRHRGLPWLLMLGLGIAARRRKHGRARRI